VYPFRTFNHEELLTLAQKTLAAARDGDHDRLEARALRLFEALSDHVLAERPALRRVSPGDARLLEAGQQRVVDRLVELAASAAQDEGSCRCDRLAANLLAELTLQADDERHHLATTTAVA
jgi:hypothetical protein